MNTHTHRVIVYICLLVPTNSMTKCRPASVLILIYDYGLDLLYSVHATNASGEDDRNKIINV